MGLEEPLRGEEVAGSRSARRLRLELHCDELAARIIERAQVLGASEVCLHRLGTAAILGPRAVNAMALAAEVGV